jgi:hypothetical protein
MPYIKNCANIIFMLIQIHLSNLPLTLHEVEIKENRISKEFFFSKNDLYV